jgi:hypothetical protein
MAPSLEPGGFAIFKRGIVYRPGDTVLVKHPRLGTIVKRIARADGGQFWLEGTSPQSTCTHDMGAVSKKALVGRLVWSLNPKTPSQKAGKV